MVVVDASIALAWCFADEQDAVAEAALRLVADEGAVAPAIWPLEVANGIRTAERRGRLEAGEVPRLRELLLSLPVQIDSVDLEAALGGVLDIARSEELSAYDAAYLALALRRGLALATIDARLTRACGRVGVELAVA